MTQKQKFKLKVNVCKSYFGFLFQTFFKRPMGYIIALVYLLFLSLILIIVPVITKTGPLSIWNLGGFNMAIFNLFFIAAMAAAIAVVLFKVGEEDGTELTLSAKPLTKNMRVAVKTTTYILIMLIISALCLILVALIWPIFGEYNIFTNITGITKQEFGSLMLSMFIGNVVNTLFFGSFAVLISLVGGQVITMIGTIGIAFIMCLMNVIYPLAVGTPITALADTYGATINSISANTLSQIENGNDVDSTLKPFATIQCTTQESGKEINHFDTYEYWTKAQKKAGVVVTNYFDFAKQLSALFSGFGLDERRLEEASKVAIGTNPSFKYSVDKTTHIDTNENINMKNYPVAIYGYYSKQGVSYPIVQMLGGNTGLSVDNWYAFSKLNQADFNSVACVSMSHRAIVSGIIFRQEIGISNYTLADVNLNLDKQGIQIEQNAAEALFNTYLNAVSSGELATTPWLDTEYYANDKKDDGGQLLHPTSAINIIKADTSNVFFNAGTWDDLETTKKTWALSKILVHWLVAAQKWQMGLIKDWCENGDLSSLPQETQQIIRNDKFPYSSTTVKNWYEINVLQPIKPGTSDYTLYNKEKLIEKMFCRGIYVNEYQPKLSEDPIPYYVYPVNSELEFCETYKNMYQYKVSSYFNVYALTAIWTSIAVALFAVAIVVYKRTDFK